jgi:hypothetical protein
MQGLTRLLCINDMQSKLTLALSGCSRIDPQSPVMSKSHIEKGDILREENLDP